MFATRSEPSIPEPCQSLFEAMVWDCGAEAIPELVRKGAVAHVPRMTNPELNLDGCSDQWFLPGSE
jgi:hypothetical protein